MTHTRRTFVKNGMAVATSISLARSFVPTTSLFAAPKSGDGAIHPADDPKLKQLIQRALDAAQSANADYADVRFTHNYVRGITRNNVQSTETIGVSVRSLVKGYWGFAAGPIWHAEEMVRLAKTATAHATASANAAGRSRETVLVDRPIVRDQHWTTPIDIDPFTIHPAHVSDHLDLAIHYHVTTRPFAMGAVFGVGFTRQEKAYGATDGTYFSQRLYRTGGSLAITLLLDGKQIGGTSDTFPEAGAGYELFDEVALRTDADRLVNAIQFDYSLPKIPIDIGRFDTVLSPSTAAAFLTHTIGTATQLDRALGFEANATGTTYLDEPETMLGSYPVASSLISVTGDRSMAKGAATVAWDDDGVKPEPFPIITKGILTNYQSSRDMVGVAKDAYTSQGKPLLSNACAQSPTAVDPPRIHTPNLTLHPGEVEHTFESLYKDMKDGVAIGGGSNSQADIPLMDQQVLNGYFDGDRSSIYQVKNGQRVARIFGAAILFRSPEFWKSIKAIGGQSSIQRSSGTTEKGQPSQRTSHSVSAVPILLEKLTYIDKKRKA